MTADALTADALTTGAPTADVFVREVPGSLGASAAAEWDALVATAVVGTDRRQPPPPQPGWDTWSQADDPAVEVLDRAAAVVAARRAGVMALPPSEVLVPVAPDDARTPCPVSCADRLQRLLAGEHPVLLAEWLDLVERHDCALPWEMLPALLLRGRRDSALDQTVRRLARGRAAWLAELVPELGVVVSPPMRRDSAPLMPPAPLAESAAAASAVVATIAEGRASWTMLPHLELVVASLDPFDLAPFVASLAAIGFDVASERTRVALLSLAEFRIDMRREFIESDQRNDQRNERPSTTPSTTDGAP